ncbi:hypothetical protein [Thalassotalea sp. Y01]|uniref:hypothetical protein n=1 Tax=Thalassotalea sp. Y01 TaxID=2729613 RepID=UPI00145D84FD|nr:hypothetical protein [Thalassotalea sp. Y01]NMP15440.1 hypothetical protein [Thalassotalea sp. Y01]
MKNAKIILSVVYSLLAAYGVVSVLLGNIPAYALVFVFLYLGTAAALNNKGGKIATGIAYFCGGMLIIFGILAVIMFISTFYGHEYDPISPIVFAVAGIVGVMTIYLLRRAN